MNQNLDSIVQQPSAETLNNLCYDFQPMLKSNSGVIEYCTSRGKSGKANTFADHGVIAKECIENNYLCDEDNVGIWTDNENEDRMFEFERIINQKKIEDCFDINEYFCKLDQNLIQKKLNLSYELFNINDACDGCNIRHIDEYSEGLNFSNPDGQLELHDSQIKNHQLNQLNDEQNTHKNKSEIKDFIIPVIHSHSNQVTESKTLHEQTFCNSSDLKESKESCRLKRWLKDQDRELFKVIYELIKSNTVSENSLSLDIDRFKESKQSWMLIKSKIITDRSISFLQMRYLKLTNNQKFNSKDLNLLSINYSKFSIENLMIMYPGKSKETILSLIKNFELKSEEAKNKENRIKLELHKNSDDIEQFSLDCSSTSILSFLTDKQLSICISSFDQLNSESYLKSFDQRMLKGLDYKIKQMMCMIYQEKNKVKSKILASINNYSIILS